MFALTVFGELRNEKIAGVFTVFCEPKNFTVAHKFYKSTIADSRGWAEAANASF